MIQANLLLNTAGKPPNSFVELDLMRLPLGILSGMGFIGGGALLRRDGLVLGVTTAATLWFVTVMGLCLGGGQIGLGMSMLGIGVVVLSLLRQAERSMTQDHRAQLTLETHDNGPSDQQIRDELLNARLRIVSCAALHMPAARRHQYRYEVQWCAGAEDSYTPGVVEQFATYAGVERVEWNPE